MSKKEQLLQALKKFNGTDDKTLEAFKVFNTAVNQLQTDLKEKMQVATLDKVNSKLTEFQNKIDFTSVLTSLTELKTALQNQADLEKQIKDLNKTIGTTSQATDSKLTNLSENLTGLANQVKDLSNQKPLDFSKQIKDSEQKLRTLITNVQTAIENQDMVDDERLKQEVKTLNEELAKVRKEFTNRLANLGGGQANRAIYFNGVDRLTRYTDINWKAGSNVTFTIANNDQTKKVDVTVSSTGGPGGSTRLITSVSANTAADSASGTDYVYLCSGTITITMPDATASNTNLYTIKNVGTGIITINTTSSQTIDGALTQIMPVQFTSIDLISDTANWAIT